MSELWFLLILLLLLQVKTRSKWDRTGEQDSEDEVNGRYKSCPWPCHCEIYHHRINIQRRGDQLCTVMSDCCASLSPSGSSSKSLGLDEDSRSDSSDASAGSRGTEMSEIKRKRLREVEASAFLVRVKLTWLSCVSHCSLWGHTWYVPYRRSWPYPVCTVSLKWSISTHSIINQSINQSNNQTLFI